MKPNVDHSRGPELPNHSYWTVSGIPLKASSLTNTPAIFVPYKYCSHLAIYRLDLFSINMLPVRCIIQIHTQTLRCLLSKSYNLSVTSVEHHSAVPVCKV